MPSKRKGKRKQRNSGDVTPDQNHKQAKISDYTISQCDIELDIEEVVAEDLFSDISSNCETRTMPDDTSTMLEAETSPPKKMLKDLIQDMNQKLNALDVIQTDITSIKKDLESIIAAVKFSEEQLAEAKKRIASISGENTTLKSTVGALNLQNNILLERLITQEDYSRRENVVISGIKEKRGENCMIEIQELFSYVGFPHIFLQRCHRIGPKRQDRDRDILVRLLHYPDKVMISSSRSKFPKGIYINDDFAAETKRKINTLRPVYKEAKKIDNATTMFKDKLYFKNKEYTVKNIRSINLDTEKVSQKSTNNVIAFAGRYSPLSNLYPTTLEVDGLTYTSSEHCYQHKKCIAAGNTSAAAAVLLSVEPEDAMVAGSTVKPSQEWIQKEGLGIMKQALKAKFHPQHMKAKLTACGKRLIVEATRSRIWGIGQPFTSPNVLQPDTYNGQNLLGTLLMELRDELS